MPTDERTLDDVCLYGNIFKGFFDGWHLFYIFKKIFLLPMLSLRRHRLRKHSGLKLNRFSCLSIPTFIREP